VDVLSTNGLGLEGNWSFERGLRCHFQALFTFLPDIDLFRGPKLRVSGYLLHQIVSTVVLKRFSLRFRPYIGFGVVMDSTFSPKTGIFVDFWSIIDRLMCDTVLFEQSEDVGLCCVKFDVDL
jgi:hypothetical protein